MAGNEKNHLIASKGQWESDAITAVPAAAGVVGEAPPDVRAGRSKGESVGRSLMPNSGILRVGHDISCPGDIQTQLFSALLCGYQIELR